MSKFGYFEMNEFKRLMREIEHGINQRREIKNISECNKPQGMI